jgi:VanZ family protein
MVHTPPTPEARRPGALVVYAMLIAYASLYPFALRAPAPEWAAQIASTRYYTLFDVLLNVIAYVPLGLLAARYFARNRDVRRGIALAVGAGIALSAAMELLQRWPARCSMRARCAASCCNARKRCANAS